MFDVDWQPAATDDLATICLNHPARWKGQQMRARGIGSGGSRGHPSAWSEPA